MATVQQLRGPRDDRIDVDHAGLVNPARARIAQTAAAAALLLGPATMAALVLAQSPLCAGG